MSVEIVKVKNDDVRELAELAKEIWNQHFPPIIGQEQVDFMVRKFQSEAPMKEQMRNGYDYYFLVQNGEKAGYFGIQPQSDNSLFLSKLYIKKSFRKKGYAGAAFEFMKKICRERRYDRIWLTVNKHNDDTIAVYRHFGMEIVASQVTDIGNGFVMDDYVFELKI